MTVAAYTVSGSNDYNSCEADELEERERGGTQQPKSNVYYTRRQIWQVDKA